MRRHWRRQGEWVEFTPGRSVVESEQAVSAWLTDTLRMPPKMLRTMLQREEIRTAGDRLRLKIFAPDADTLEPADAPADILYEDDACLVAYKPAGMPVHATTPEQDRQKNSLAHAVACHYIWTGQEVRVRHIHRLDVATSGPVLYAKQAFTHAVLDEAMRRKEIQRHYAAIVQGQPNPKRGTIDAPIGKDRHHSSKRRVSPGGDYAVTHYEVAETGSQMSLVRLSLETGRTHQIRVHMSYKGHPLIGDALYGGDDSGFQRQALHGESLRFLHPLSGEWMEVDAPWPEDMNRLRQKI
ncbi:RluA family pseudouridine synthase [Paenibacillus apiarius]|uniref:RluA family pseudouridine synthase n=1 Tax=Paenibacillus apiarius TaxID=46240 RepID=UPI003B3A6533